MSDHGCVCWYPLALALNTIKANRKIHGEIYSGICYQKWLTFSASESRDLRKEEIFSSSYVSEICVCLWVCCVILGVKTSILLVDLVLDLNVGVAIKGGNGGKFANVGLNCVSELVNVTPVLMFFTLITSLLLHFLFLFFVLWI